jgi:hypothetical protein
MQTLLRDAEAGAIVSRLREVLNENILAVVEAITLELQRLGLATCLVQGWLIDVEAFSCVGQVMRRATRNTIMQRVRHSASHEDSCPITLR